MCDETKGFIEQRQRECWYDPCLSFHRAPKQINQSRSFLCASLWFICFRTNYNMIFQCPRWWIYLDQSRPSWLTKCMSSYKWVEVTLYLHFQSFPLHHFHPFSPWANFWTLISSCSNTLLGIWTAKRPINLLLVVICSFCLSTYAYTISNPLFFLPSRVP